ncbi:MAG: crotonase/enoyl-CoA hydratase family protein [Xanthobacteraceae bacterium]|nr:crotonase/enoyl-CoA hydratase family protein [Xanthobacteraceae bacterium]GIK80528.1 MAG: enoyl-CoA hydratase [Alphaproteobacteria bacterium]
MSSDAVTYDARDGIAVVTLNRPETRNALSQDVVEGLIAACDRVNQDLSVGCVVLTGNGPAFCSGGNVKEMHERNRAPFMGSAAEMRRAYRHGIQQIPMAMYDLEAPVIAAVNGPAIGAGLDLAAMCDIRLAADGASFAESFLRVGLISGDGGAWFLPRVVGMPRALEMTYTADPISAQQALTMGLVSAIVTPEQLMEKAQEMAKRIARHPPHSLRLTKRLLRESARVDLPAALELAAAMQAIVQHTADQQEAVAAFLQKRSPVFRGN